MHLCVKPALLKVPFRRDVRVDKIETRVSFPALFNVGTGIRESLSDRTRQAIYEQNIVQKHSRKNCCRGKATIIIYSECVCSLFYPARKAQAPYSNIICGLIGSTIFFQIIS